MKRLLAQTGLTYFAVLAVVFYLPRTVSLILFGIGALLTALFFVIRKIRRTIFLPAMAVALSLACIVGVGFDWLVVDRTVERYAHDDALIEAHLTDEPYRSYSRLYYRLRADEVDGQKASFDLMLVTNTPINAEAYDRITFTGDIVPSGRDDLRAKGYYLRVDAYSVDCTIRQPDARPPYYYAILLRQAIRQELDELLPPDEAALAKAVFIGDKYSLDTSAKEDFRRAGVSHLIVVSGMHFSILMAGLFWLIARQRRQLRRHRVLTLAAIPVILLYMALVGFSPSVTRAGLMMLVWIAAGVLRRMSYPPNSLALSAVLMTLFFSPCCAGDIGLILSVAATYGVIKWASPIYERIQIRKTPRDTTLPRKQRAIRCAIRATNGVLAILAVSLAAQVLVIPLSILLFHEFSLLSVFSCLLLYGEIWAIITLSLICCILCPIPLIHYAAVVMSYPLRWACDLALWVVRWLSAIPHTYVRLSPLFVVLWLIASALILAGIILYKKNNKLIRYTAAVSIAVLLTGTLVNAVVTANTRELRLYPADSGVAATVNIKGSLTVVEMDCGYLDATPLMRELSRRCGSADAAICTDDRELNNLTRLGEREFAIYRCLLYDRVEGSGMGEVTRFGAESLFVLDEGVGVRVIPAGRRTVTRLEYGDHSVLFIPGKVALGKLTDAQLTADIAVVSDVTPSYRRLRCDTLLICADESRCEQIRSELSACCREARRLDSETVIQLR